MTASSLLPHTIAFLLALTTKSAINIMTRMHVQPTTTKDSMMRPVAGWATVRSRPTRAIPSTTKLPAHPLITASGAAAATPSLRLATVFTIRLHAQPTLNASGTTTAAQSTAKTAAIPSSKHALA